MCEIGKLLAALLGGGYRPRPTYFCKLAWELGEDASPICTAFPATTGNPYVIRPTQLVNEVIDNATTFGYRIAVQLADCLTGGLTFRQARLARWTLRNELTVSSSKTT